MVSILSQDVVTESGVLLRPLTMLAGAGGGGVGGYCECHVALFTATDRVDILGSRVLPRTESGGILAFRVSGRKQRRVTQFSKLWDSCARAPFPFRGWLGWGREIQSSSTSSSHLGTLNTSHVYLEANLTGDRPL